MSTDKKKILLISPPWYRIFGGSSEWSPLGLCYLASVLEKHGYNVSVYNADYKTELQLTSVTEMTSKYDEYLRILKDQSHPLWQEIGTVIKEQSPDIVGISVLTAKYGSALNISRLVKKYNPDIPVIWGGVHPTLLPDETIKNKEVDIVVRGEGEYTFLHLIENLKSPEKVPGITYKKNGEIIHNQDRPLIPNLDELPFPARHLILAKENYHPESFGNIFASRGCPYHCIFCASHKVWTRQVRYRSPKNVVDEIKEIIRVFHTRKFRFEDDSFTLNKKFVEGICDLLIKEKLGIKWTTETRVDLVTDGLIKGMKAAGCEDITMGVESGDEKTLQMIKKGISLEQVRNAKKILKKNRMDFSAFFIIGFPWETKQEIDKTVAFMQELDPREAGFSLATPYPGTELYDLCLSEKLIPESLDWSTFYHQSPNLNITHKLTREEVTQIVKEAENIFERHNNRKWRAKLLSDPLYVIGRLIKGKYYNPQDLRALFHRYFWK